MQAACEVDPLCEYNPPGQGIGEDVFPRQKDDEGQSAQVEGEELPMEQDPTR